MNTTKRILFTLVVLSLVIASVLGLVACNKLSNPVQMRETEIIIPLDSAIMSDISGKHLVDYLNALKDKEFLTYEMKGSMIVTINGRTADGAKNEYWMIYTDDEENSSTEYGTYTVNDVTYGSSNFGVNDLPLKEGKKYIFVISKW